MFQFHNPHPAVLYVYPLPSAICYIQYTTVFQVSDDISRTVKFLNLPRIIALSKVFVILVYIVDLLLPPAIRVFFQTCFPCCSFILCAVAAQQLTLLELCCSVTVQLLCISCSFAAQLTACTQLTSSCLCCASPAHSLLSFLLALC